MATRDSGQPHLLTDQEFLEQRLQAEPAKRLAVRVVIDAANGLRGLAARATARMQQAFEGHIANLSERSQEIATRLAYAELTRMPPREQAQLVKEGAAASAVAEAAARQRRVPAEVQAALIEHCSEHAAVMRHLAARADASIETLAALVDSEDGLTRLSVAKNMGSRMRMDEPALTEQKQAVFDRLVTGFETDYAPYLVPVCRDPEQLAEMYTKISKTLGMLEVFVDNPDSPDTLLIDIAASPRMHVVQHEASRRAKEVLHHRALRHETIDNNDLAPS